VMRDPASGPTMAQKCHRKPRLAVHGRLGREELI
jgi:hypothetical protein